MSVGDLVAAVVMTSVGTVFLVYSRRVGTAWVRSAFFIPRTPPRDELGAAIFMVRGMGLFFIAVGVWQLAKLS